MIGLGRHIRRVNLLSAYAGPGPFRLETWAIEPARPAITLTLRPRSRTARCPLCGTLRPRPQPLRADLRRPALGRPRRPDSAAGAPPVLRQRRCERRIFAERLPGIAAPWARRTARLTTRQTAIGLALGGAAGARLCRELGPPAARNTLLRLVRPPPRHPRYPGCPRRRRLGAAQAPQLRHRAGRPGAAPAGGAAARPRGRHLRPLAARPPRVAIVARDRSGAYADGSGAARPRRCRSPTASTSCRTWRRRWRPVGRHEKLDW